MKSYIDINEIRPEISNRNIIGKSPNTMKLNNTLLCNRRVKEDVSKEIKIYIELNENENLWDAAKAVLRGKFIAPT